MEVQKTRGGHLPSFVSAIPPPSPSVTASARRPEKETWASCANARFSFCQNLLANSLGSLENHHMSRGGRGGFGRGGGATLCVFYLIARPFIVSSQEGDSDAVEDHLETQALPIPSLVRIRNLQSSKLTE